MSYFAPGILTPITFDKQKVYAKTSFDCADSFGQPYQRSTLAHRNQRLQDLADKIGLDGIALCSNEEDYTLDKELNFELVTKPEAPWYE